MSSGEVPRCVDCGAELTVTLARVRQNPNVRCNCCYHRKIWPFTVIVERRENCLVAHRTRKHANCVAKKLAAAGLKPLLIKCLNCKNYHVETREVA